MILKFQQGGAALPPLVSYQPVTVTGGATTGASSDTKSSNSSSDLTDKDLLELLEKLDGLPSDMASLTNELQNFYIDQQYNPFPSTSNIASRYIGIINKIRTANFNRKQYDAAFDILKANGGLNEIAINENGAIFCVNKDKDFKLLTPEQLANQSEYTAVTNSELLEYRAYNPETAFNTSITSVLQNGIGMQSVTKMIQDIVSHLGTNTESKQGYVSTQAKTILRGIEDFKKAINESNGDFNPTINNLYKYKLVDENQAKQIQQAFNYIYATLPENAKSLLKYKASGIEGGMETLLAQMIGSQSNSKFEFTLDLENTKGTSKDGSKSAKGVGDFDLDPVSMLQADYGEKQTITIQTAAGNNRGLQVDTVRMPIVTKEGSSIGTDVTLTDVSKSMFAGYLNFDQASMGGAMLDTTGFSKVAVNGTALYTAYLPVDVAEMARGNIKPDIDMLGRYKEVQQQIKEQNITDKEQINELYRQARLPIMFTENGDVTTNYIKFGILNGNALSTAFREDAEFADWLYETRDKNEINNVLSIINKGRSGNDLVDFDTPSWWDTVSPIFNSSDHMYRGTIFIPVNTDHFTATAATGKYPSTGEAQIIEARQKSKARAEAANKSYNNPGNQL